jgi:hypothetical protein
MLQGLLRSANGTFSEYVIVPAESLPNVGLMAGAAGFQGSIDDFSVKHVGGMDLTLIPNVDLIVASLSSPTLLTPVSLAHNYELSVADAASAGSLDIAVLIAGGAPLTVADLLSQSALPKLLLDVAIAVGTGSRVKVRQKWVDHRKPHVYSFKV